MTIKNRVNFQEADLHGFGLECPGHLVDTTVEIVRGKLAERFFAKDTIAFIALKTEVAGGKTFTNRYVSAELLLDEQLVPFLLDSLYQADPDIFNYVISEIKSRRPRLNKFIDAIVTNIKEKEEEENEDSPTESETSVDSDISTTDNREGWKNVLSKSFKK